MDEGLLSLKWNNHKGTFLHILTALRDKPLHSDVTLACGGSLYPVHKLVLSACSSYFESIFASISCQQPVIVLKDIRSEDLEALLDYMYAGEVEVKHSSLASLIKAAECLCIKGLAVPDGDPSHTSTPNKSRSLDSIPEGSTKRRKLDTSGLGDAQDRRKGTHNNHSPMQGSRLDASGHKPDAVSQSQNAPGNQRNNGEVTPTHKETPQKSRHKRKLDESLSALARSDAAFTQHSGDVSDGSCDAELKNDVSADKGMMEAVVKVEMEEDGLDADELLIEKTEAAEYDDIEETSSLSGMTPSREAGGSKLYMAAHHPNFDPEVLHDKMADIRSVLDGSYRTDDSILLEGCAGEYFSGKTANYEPSAMPSDVNPSLLSIPGLLGSTLTFEEASSPRVNVTYKCSICYKDFGRNWLLKRHMRTHTGEKPYACGFCSYRSSYRYQLAMHVQSVHGGQHDGSNV